LATLIFNFRGFIVGKKNSNLKTLEMAQVEQLLDRKSVRGRVHYLVRWQGFTDENDTWYGHI